MTFIRGITLGAAAALTLGAAAQAADLPSRKSAPAAYVKICDVYGRGFYYIPGTNTCLHVGGRARFEFAYRPATNVWVHGRSGGTAVNGALYDTIGWRARAYVDMDARTQTAWGTVQTFTRIAVRSRTGLFGGSSTAGPQTPATNSVQLYAAYIRFAGFTAGRTRGIFYFMPSNMYEPQYWASSSTGEVQLAYTATFGGGFSATIGLEDANDFGYNNRATRLNVGGFTPIAPIFPTRMPAIVGNLRVDQGWGSAQLMGAWVKNDMVLPIAANNNVKVSKPGWALGAGLRINLPMLGKGDRLYLTAAYANGFLDLTHSRYLNGNTSHGRMMGGFTEQGSNVALYSTNGGVSYIAELSKSWSIGALFSHYWTPTIASHVAASYVSITPGAREASLNWYTAGGMGKEQAFAVGHSLQWTPVRDFQLGLEIGYRKVRNQLTAVGPAWGSAAATNTIGVKQNPSMVFGRVRAERKF